MNRGRGCQRVRIRFAFEDDRLRRRSEAVLFEKGKVIGNLSGTGGEEIGKVHGAERASCGGMEEADLRQAIFIGSSNHLLGNV